MSKREFRELSDTTKQKMSVKKQGICNPQHGKAMPDEVKQKISDKLRAYWSTIPSKDNDSKTNENE